MRFHVGGGSADCALLVRDGTRWFYGSRERSKICGLYVIVSYFLVALAVDVVS